MHHSEYLLELLDNLVNDGISRGEFRPNRPALVATMAFAFFQVVADRDVQRRLDTGYSALLKEAMDLFLHGLLKHD